VTGLIRISLASRVCPVATSRPWARFAQAQSAFRPTWYVPSVAGLAKHSVKHTGMAGIDTNVWPLGLQELSSG
jgi:hypothetical protein